MTEPDEIIAWLNKLDPNHAPVDCCAWRIGEGVSVIRRSPNHFEIVTYMDVCTSKRGMTNVFELLERLTEINPDIAAKLAEPMK